MANDVPQHFDRAFLRWFQERTEETWQKYQTRTFESFVAALGRDPLGRVFVLGQQTWP